MVVLTLISSESYPAYEIDKLVSWFAVSDKISHRLSSVGWHWPPPWSLYDQLVHVTATGVIDWLACEFFSSHETRGPDILLVNACMDRYGFPQAKKFRGEGILHEASILRGEGNPPFRTITNPCSAISRRWEPSTFMTSRCAGLFGGLLIKALRPSPLMSSNQ